LTDKSKIKVDMNQLTLKIYPECSVHSWD